MPETKVDFIVIDTIQLCGNTRDVENGSFLDVRSTKMYHHYPLQYMTATKHTQPPGPANVEAAERQWAWLNETLFNSR